jgi:hypothetical protein
VYSIASTKFKSGLKNKVFLDFLYSLDWYLQHIEDIKTVAKNYIIPSKRLTLNPKVIDHLEEQEHKR